MKNFDVVALGELLIDFTENGKSAQGNMTYEANPGGAPCNVLAMLNKAGRKTAFIGKVGQDLFGNKLKATLDEVGIDTSNLIIDEDARTTLAFVETFPDGDRDFSFYRNPGADMMLRKEDLHEDLIRDAKIFHYGTLSMTHDGVREATKKAIDIANESGAILSFDPNLRPFPDGDRDFSFYRNPGADMMLRKEDLHEDLIRDAKIFHYGTLSMTHDGVREATKKAIDIAKESGAILSFDPNLRPPLWKTLDDAKEQVAYGLSKCDVLKISDNEIQWFTGEEDFDAGIAKLREQYNIPLIMLSLGRDGSRAYYKDLRVEVKPFLQDSTIETTGAGDTFGGCCLHHVLKYGLDNLDEEKLTEMLTFANAAASIVTTRKGALRVMPEVEEVEAFIKSRA